MFNGLSGGYISKCFLLKIRGINKIENFDGVLIINYFLIGKLFFIVC